MKRVVLYIKRFFVFMLVYMCLFQMSVLLFSECSPDKQNVSRQQNVGEKKMSELDRLRKDTKDIININFFYCTRIRNVAIKNEEGQIISYKEDVIKNLKVRLSSFDGYVDKSVLVPNIEISKIQYVITVEYDVDIKENDILKIDDFFDGRVFRVVEVEPYFFGGEKTMETCYKKSGKVELLKVD